MRILLITFIGLLSNHGLSQPNTDIYLFKLTENGLESPVNISENPGYDNQPSFWADSKSVLYARTMQGQTDIARYHIESRKTEIISSTLQGSEYSPMQIPGTEEISSIRLDTTGLQLLYRYTLDGQSEVLIEDLKIGYHAWIESNKLAAFVLGDPVSLQLLDLSNGRSRYIEENIGRSLHTFPAGAGFSYVNKTSSPWRIYLYQMKNEFKDGLIDLPENVEDYCWSPEARKIYTSEGSNILVTHEGAPWALFDNLTDHGLNGTVSRMAISHDGHWMAIVIEQEEE